MNENQENLEEKGLGLKNRRKIWLTFFALITLLSLIVTGISLIIGFKPYLAFAIGAGLWFLIIILTLISGYFEVPHKHEDIVECMGSYIGYPLKPGPYILFPYFSLEKIVSRVFMGEQKLELYLNDQEGSDGDVEFKDCSASLKAFFFFKIVDSEKATYHVDDVVAAIKERADHILRAFFGVYSLDNAIKLKSYFRIENVVSLLDVSSDSPNVGIGEKEVKKLNISLEEAKKTNFFVTLKSWGVEPKSFVISDIEIPKEIKEQRSRILTAEKDREVAKIGIKTARKKKKTTIVNAQAEKKKIFLEGQGDALRVKSIMNETQLSGTDVANYLVANAKWQAIAENGNITLIEDSGGKTSDGVKLGVGIGAATKKKEASSKTKKSN